MVGSTQAVVEHKGQTHTLPLIVTKGNRPSLLGRDWLMMLRLDWHGIFTLESPRTLQEVLEENSEVFKPGLGKLKGVTAKLYVDPTVRPRFHKPRPVPFALRKRNWIAYSQWVCSGRCSSQIGRRPLSQY